MTERISRDDVAHVARLARLELTDDEVDHMVDDLAAILDHASDVAGLDLDAVAPTTNPLALTNVWREDVVGPTLDRGEVLAAAPAAEDDRFRVPAILDAEV